MNQFKHYTIAGILFVLITGTLSHFFYQWTGNNFIAGLFTPVNESTWEHMKLIFFPMLLYSPVMIRKFKEHYPCMISSISFGILSGTLFIPIIFYTYTGVLGYNIFILDLITFALSDIIAFYIVYKFSLSCKIQDYTLLLWSTVFIFIICFILFTYYPPNIGLFAEPAISAAINAFCQSIVP